MDFRYVPVRELLFRMVLFPDHRDIPLMQNRSDKIEKFARHVKAFSAPRGMQGMISTPRLVFLTQNRNGNDSRRLPSPAHPPQASHGARHEEYDRILAVGKPPVRARIPKPTSPASRLANTAFQL